MFELLSIKSVSKKYGIKQALKNIDIEILKGRIVGLLGPNGSGKTTLIKIIAGILKQTEGIVTIDGQEPNEITKSYVAYLPDKDFLDENMSIDNTISMFEDFYDDFSSKTAYELLDNLQVPPNSKIKTLSKGNREKVQLILVMSRRAKLYILDEPIAGVDPAARDYILNTIISNYNREAAVLLSTHLIADVEKILDDVIFLKNGEIILQGAADKIRSEKGCSIDAYFREVFNAENNKVRIQAN